MNRLTPTMRAALEAARKGPLRRTHDHSREGRPPWPAAHNTLAALLDRGLLEHEVRRNNAGWWMEQWAITDAGREALLPPRRTARDTPRLMHGAAPTTTYPMQGGVWVTRTVPEPEMLTPSPEWDRRGKARHARDRDRKKAARSLGRRAA